MGKCTNIDYLTYETCKLNIRGGHTANRFDSGFKARRPFFSLPR